MVALVEAIERSNNDYFRSFLPAVNSPSVAHRETGGAATGVYRPYGEEYSTPPQRARQERPAHPEAETERPKKDKKWSIGKLFRRKKKDDDSVSSSESDEGVSTHFSSKRKTKKKKKNATPTVDNFDHIVMRDGRRAQSLVKHNDRDLNDEGVLSDPSAGFINYRAKIAHPISKESLNSRVEVPNKPGKAFTETVTRKTRKGRRKARVEALRNSIIGESSSDEDSLKSSNSSSMVRFRSDDSLMRSRDSSLNKRSRSARTERHSKRLSRDDENQLNKEAELLQQGYTKAEVEMLTRTPTSQSSGYGTCKRENQSKIKAEQPLHANDPSKRPMKSESISSFPSTQSYPSSINFNAKINNENINYSIKYPLAKKEPVYVNSKERNIKDPSDNIEKIMCVKFPLGNVTNVKKEERSPPVPPPRDMHRKIATPISMYYENNPMITDRMAHNRNGTSFGVQNNDFERVMRRSQDRSLNPVMNGLRRPISNSEDHIAMQNNECVYNFNSYRNEQPKRPASVSAEPNHYALYVNTPPWRNKIEQSRIIRPEPVAPNQDYLYFADESPRSRRPISIKSNQNGYDGQYLSDSQASLSVSENMYRRPRNASEFWKKLEDAEKQKKHQNIFSRNQGVMPNNVSAMQKSKIYADPNDIRARQIERVQKSQTPIPQPNIETKCKLTLHTEPRDSSEGVKMWKATTEYKRSVTVEPPKTVMSPNSKTHVRHKSDTFITSSYQVPSDDEKSSERRKSTNLDDALNELEAIYNSLGLGDEDLLDRAERRESMTPNLSHDLNDWNGNDEIELRSQPSTPLRRIHRRSTLPDKLQDDMAFRRMNSKEKPINRDSQMQISYMLASPVYIPYASDDDKHSDRNEPDIIHDDVVYRNIKQTNNRLKTLDPQPPFGIPVGPVSPAPQSDYLHATPENRGRSRFIPRRSPDLVCDDLAYRSLRKDNTRNSSLFNGEEFSGHNNNQSYGELVLAKDLTTNKKKRAVRSLSANIFTMIQKEIDDALSMSKKATLQKTHSNHDVNRRLRESNEINDNDQDHYPRNKVKQRHNTVSLFVNNTHPPHHFAKDDSFIYSDDKYLPKPSSCDKSKSSSPLHKSPQSSKRSSKDEFQQVLTMLAQEAMDTSNKLGVALAELDKNRNNNERKSDIQSKISDSRLNFLNTLTQRPSIQTNLPEVRGIKLNSKITNNTSFDKTSVKNFEDNLKAKKTEDSLLTISSQLHKVEDKLKHSHEKEIKLDDESANLSKYILKAEEQIKVGENVTASPETKLFPNVLLVSAQNDVQTVQNSNRPQENEEFISKTNDLLIDLNSDCKIKELNEIRAFKELKDGISDLIAGISQANDKLFISDKREVPTNIEKPQVGGITEVNEKLCNAEVNEKLFNATQDIKKDEHVNRTSVNLSIYEDDLEIKKEYTDSTEYNSSEELATIFKLDQSRKSNSPNKNDCNTKIVDSQRNDLSSPKLVKSMNQQLRRFSIDNTDDVYPSQSNSMASNVVPWRLKRQNNSSNSQRDEPGVNEGPKRPWHRSPGTLMLACTYTLVCSQNVAQLDWLTLLGLILAIVTIIAMLLI
ncbi:hypothetical protein EVAR_53219_1 [Eumeta japonica]|uniref:Uncharacterized protein n=1 Tax=Eumeta variegata TaxID=151549 RepID=A0A4C1XFR9_EUMVA|nr:hypothetical protein EVAR_53219_1 [Eumeta japonica]